MRRAAGSPHRGRLRSTWRGHWPGAGMSWRRSPWPIAPPPPERSRRGSPPRTLHHREHLLHPVVAGDALLVLHEGQQPPEYDASHYTFLMNLDSYRIWLSDMHCVPVMHSISQRTRPFCGPAAGSYETGVLGTISQSSGISKQLFNHKIASDISLNTSTLAPLTSARVAPMRLRP